MMRFEDTGLEAKPHFQMAWGLGFSKYIEVVAPAKTQDERIATAAQAFKISNLNTVKTLQKYCDDISDTAITATLMGPLVWQYLSKEEKYLRDTFNDDVADLVIEAMSNHGKFKLGDAAASSLDFQRIFVASLITTFENMIIPGLKNKQMDPASVTAMMAALKQPLAEVKGTTPALDKALEAQMKIATALVKGPSSNNSFKPKGPKS